MVRRRIRAKCSVPLILGLLLSLVPMDAMPVRAAHPPPGRSSVDQTAIDATPIKQDTSGLTTPEQIVADAVESGLVTGAVLTVSKRGRVLSERAFGYANAYAFDGVLLAHPDTMTIEHAFDVASLTKVFATTFGVMLLVDRGDVDLDAAVRVYLPDFNGPEKSTITIRNLLTHTSGLAQWKPIYFHATSKEEAFAYIRSLPLEYAVGTERHYSDLGFMLLGYVIERVSGLRLDRFLEKELYGPLGLRRTGFNQVSGPWAATSQGNPFERRMVEDPDFGYRVDEDPNAFTRWRTRTLVGEVNDGNSWYAHGGVAGHAGLFSTAHDLTILLSLLLNDGLGGGCTGGLGGGPEAGKQLISERVIHEFLTPDGNDNGNNNGNGLGWVLSASLLPIESMPIESMPEGAFGHTGFTGTYAFADPDSGITLVLLTNRQNRGVNSDGRYPSLSALRRAVTKAVLASAN